MIQSIQRGASRGASMSCASMQAIVRSSRSFAAGASIGVHPYEAVGVHGEAAMNPVEIPVGDSFEIGGGPARECARKFNALPKGHRTMVTFETQIPDPEVAEGWTEHFNLYGRRFYYNRVTRKTQWKHPVSGSVQPRPIEERWWKYHQWYSPIKKNYYWLWKGYHRFASHGVKTFFFIGGICVIPINMLMNPSEYYQAGVRPLSTHDKVHKYPWLCSRQTVQERYCVQPLEIDDQEEKFSFKPDPKAGRFPEMGTY